MKISYCNSRRRSVDVENLRLDLGIIRDWMILVNCKAAAIYLSVIRFFN